MSEIEHDEAEQSGASAPQPPPPRKSSGSRGSRGSRGAARRRISAVVGVFGELLITAGVVLALFVAYSLWWTNVLADRDSKR
ncbi:MAG TPA: class E sortase, partial [Streptomyces sp.]|nr:class E sortase [Streptomyces sp.]